MAVTRERFEQGMTYDQYKDSMTRNRERLEENERTVKFDQADLAPFKDLIADLPEVLECYSVTGDFDYVLKVIARDLQSLSRFLMDTLMRLPGVTSFRSSICLEEIKCTSALPLRG